MIPVILESAKEVMNLKAVAAKVPDEVYSIILYRAARRGVTVSVVVRETLEHAFNPKGGIQ